MEPGQQAEPIAASSKEPAVSPPAPEGALSVGAVLLGVAIFFGLVIVLLASFGTIGAWAGYGTAFLALAGYVIWLATRPLPEK